MSGHMLDVHMEYGSPSVSLRCLMPPDAPCRRRPPDYENRESWSLDESTETGHVCWAVEWIDLAGQECISVDSHHGLLASVPVTLVYDEGPVVTPLDGDA